MKQAPKAIIKEGKVINHEELKRYWADYNFRQDRIRRRMFNDLRKERVLEEETPQVIEHIHRHSDMSQKDFAQLQQIVRKVDYIEKHLVERGNLYTIGP